jgi:hypothetical protein
MIGSVRQDTAATTPEASPHEQDFFHADDPGNRR